MSQKILEKIQKLLARADENRNDNENERDIAMRQANALLVKHGLTMVDLTDQTERKETFGKLGRSPVELTTHNVWESGIFNVIAKLNGCRVVRIPARDGKRQSLWIIGRQLHCSTTRYLSEYVVSSIKRQAKIEKYTLSSFGVGAWNGLAVQVKRILEAQKAGKIDDQIIEKSTALMIVNQYELAVKEATRAKNQFFPRTSSCTSRTRTDVAGVNAGRKYGENINLNKQVNGTRQKAITN